jgi:hypothetical protein
VQLAAGTGLPDLPHTRARAVHWLATAAALAVVTGGVALIESPSATATTGHAPGGPDPAAARYPLECGPFGVLVTDRAAVDLDGDGRTETVAAVRCDAAGGTPPSGVYLLTHPADGAGRPLVAATLVDPAEGMVVARLAAGDGTISARLVGYSSPEVPRSEPDLQGNAAWEWRDGRLVLTAGPPPAPPPRSA